MQPFSRRRARFVALAISLFTSIPARTQDSPLTKARDLYRGAAYDDALALLNTLHGSTQAREDVPVIEQYRALCLVALGRSDEAERAMETAVSVAPAYHISGDEAPPRVRTAFNDVRRRLVPGIIEQTFGEAKAAFDRKEFATASAAFKQVLDLMADADLAAVVGRPPFSDFRVLSTDFMKLSDAALAPPPAPKQAAPAAPPVPPPAPAAPTPARRVEPRIYGPEDSNVVPPSTIRQVLPPVGDVFAVRQGVVEIIIDETGSVEAATMRMAVNPVYDRLVLSAAKTWRYRAATIDGTPVKFRKIVQIDIKPR